MRRRVFASLIVVIVLAGLLEWTGLMAEDARPSLQAGTNDPSDSPPPGYKSMVGVKLAIVLGQLKLINPRAAVPESVEVRRDIEYGKGGEESLKLDLYSPKTVKRPVPGLIFIHGGAWKGGKRSDYHFYTVRFAERGYVVATVSYRLLPKSPFPAAVHDVKCAVRWMRANARKLNVDPDRIGVIGGSAGGHLAMMIGYSSDVPKLEGTGGHAGVSSRVQAVVNLYGPVDLTTPYASGNSLIIRFLGGKTIEESRTRYELASPISHITRDDPPTLIFHGTIDDTVPIDQADRLAEKLKSTRVPYRYDRLEGWPHAMDLAEVVNQRCQRLMMEFFKKHLLKP